jgi:hypothetical protein
MPEGWIFKTENGFDVFGQAEILVLIPDLETARKQAYKIAAQQEQKTRLTHEHPIHFDQDYYVNEGSSY